MRTAVLVIAGIVVGCVAALWVPFAFITLAAALG